MFKVNSGKKVISKKTPAVTKPAKKLLSKSPITSPKNEPSNKELSNQMKVLNSKLDRIEKAI